MPDILEHFPAKYAPRQMQKDLMARIGGALESGHKRIILSAPTGIGKSLIAAAFASSFEDSFVVTASKHLQDQYRRDLEFLLPVKGKSNFACPKLMQIEKVSTEGRAFKNGLTCDKGACIETVQTETGSKQRPCPFKPTIAQVRDRVPGEWCPYYVQKYAALTGKHSLWNYASYLQAVKYNRRVFAEYLSREASVFDEAHKLEDQIVDFVGVDVYAGPASEAGINMEGYDSEDIGVLLGILEKMESHYRGRIEEAEKRAEPGDADAEERIYKMTARAERISASISDVEQDPSNFVVGRPQTWPDGRFRSVSAKPVDISKYVGDFLVTPLQMFMSATIDKNSFCENTGIPRDEVAVVDAPRSPFPLEARRVVFEDVRSLSSRSSDQDKAAVVDAIDRVMTEHAGERGLVLTSSISWCRQIKDGLSPANAARVRICHSKNPDGRTQDEIIDEHAGTPGSVLLSSSLWEGVDLKDDLSRFQIIAKAPYPSLSERRVAVKMRRFPRWYSSQTLTKMLQGMGRSVRGEGDRAVTYVLDEAAHRVILRGVDMVPRAYHDALGLAA